MSPHAGAALLSILAICAFLVLAAAFYRRGKIVQARSRELRQARFQIEVLEAEIRRVRQASPDAETWIGDQNDAILRLREAAQERIEVARALLQLGAGDAALDQVDQTLSLTARWLAPDDAVTLDAQRLHGEIKRRVSLL